MKVLVTGFDAFAGAATNPSGEIAAALARHGPFGPFAAIDSVVLPTIYDEAAARIVAAIERATPDLVVMFGLAGDSSGLRLERFALNVADSEVPDNAGTVRRGATIVPEGPAALTTSVDLERVAAICEGMRNARPAVSNHAGTFVCNCVYYSALHRLAATRARVPALFVHVPWTLPVAAAADLDRPPIERLVEAAREVLLATAAAATETPRS